MGVTSLGRKSGTQRSRKDKPGEVVKTVLVALSDKVHLVEKRLISDSQGSVRINPQEIREVATAIKSSLDGVIGETVVGVDLLNNRYELIYFFWSLTKKVLIEVRTQLEGDNPSIDSICDIFPGLDWHEREIHEMFGVKFNGHPNLSLLLLPEELEEAYPLRKSFGVSRDRLNESGILGPVSRSTKQPESLSESSTTEGGDKSSEGEVREGEGR